MDTDRARERAVSLRRSRVARRGLVAGAVVGSLGVAGALGVAAATAATGSSAGQPVSSRAGSDDGPGDWLVVPGTDDDGAEGNEDGGRLWVPLLPSPQFGGGGSAPAPHATSGGS